MKFTKDCIFCGKVHTFDVEREKYTLWKNGALIQNVWPEKSRTELEMMISGTCVECWNKFMKL